MSGYIMKDLLGAAKIVGASQSNVDLGTSGLSASGCKSLRVHIKAEDVTLTTGITVRIQQLIFDTYVNLASANSSVAITADGSYVLRMDNIRSADQADMPLAKQIRLVVSTGTGDAVTISKVELFQA